MVRILSVACAVLALAVSALAWQVHDAPSRIDVLEQRAAATPAPRGPAPLVRRATDDDDPSGSGPSADDAPFGGFGRARSGAARVEAIRDAVAAAGDGEGAASDEQRVSNLVRGELQRIDDEKQQAREARQIARVAEELDKLQADAKLSTEQRQQIETMMQAEVVEMRQLFADARDNGTWGDLRDKMRAVRQKTDDNAASLLDNDAQKASYQAMRDDERQRFQNAFGGGRNRGGDANNNSAGDR